MRIVKILSVFVVVLVLATVAVAEGGQVLLNAAGATFLSDLFQVVRSISSSASERADQLPVNWFGRRHQSIDR